MVAGVLLVGSLAGCRGTESDRPPIHPNLNMDFQERFDPQERNDFFADRRAMRPVVAGTIARGFLREDRAFYEGRTDGGGFVSGMPIPVSREILRRGQERFNIYCAVCHGATGDGRGTITAGGYGFTPAPTFHDDRMRGLPEGHFFDAITYGIRTMPAYGPQIAVADRWAIVAYLRALQRSQHASIEDVPSSMRATLRPVGGAPETPDESADTTSVEGIPQ